MSDIDLKINQLAVQGVPDRASELGQLFPEVMADGKIDVEKLKLLLGEAVEESPERYGLDWPGKREAMRLAQKQSTATLEPMDSESVAWDTTKNIIIEGDNLEVLKLLQKSYYGQVKLIYIDPPYNTGNDFVYNDDFAEPTESYLSRSGQADGEGFRTSSNRETSGRFHSDWLSMMHPRLLAARNLLAPDGVIFISISDRESHNLRLLVEEIFGPENFIADIAHRSRASVSSDKIISENHTHVLLLAKDKSQVEKRRSEFGLEPDLAGFEQGDPADPYKLVPVDGPGGAKKGNPFYEFLGVSGYWRFSKQRMQSMYDEGLIVRTTNGLQQKYFRSKAALGRKTDTTWWQDAGLTSNATKSLANLMGGKYFDNPKPVSLVRRMLKLWAREENDLILDFFAGSGTTGHAVMQQNVEDSGSRRYILVQLPEATGTPDFPKISDITRERVRRAGTAIKMEDNERANDLDIGFRAYKLAASNFKNWDAEVDSLFTEDLEAFVDNINTGASDAGIVHEIMLKAGLRLDTDLTAVEIAGAEVTLAEGGAVAVSANRHITQNFIDGLLALEPRVQQVFLLDAGFGENDSLKVNARHQFAARRSESDPDKDDALRTV